MAPYQVIISYDGTDFCGFQRQKNARTIQKEVEQALRELGWAEKAILFAGRTDTGVHAEGQVIFFHLDWRHSEWDLKNALNDHLPGDIAVRSVEKTHEGFHPRYDAKSRIYRYQIYVSPAREPLLERFFWRLWPAPDFDILLKSAEGIIGKHDFRRLGCEINREDKDSLRTVNSAAWHVMDDRKLIFRISAPSFLYHMVRRIVYLLVQAGQQKLDAVILNKDVAAEELPAGIAPAKGLFLEQVIY